MSGRCRTAGQTRAVCSLTRPRAEGGLQSYNETSRSNWTTLLQVVNLVVSLVIITALFAIKYKFLPRAKIGWHDVWIGAAVTALLFTVGKLLIGLYIGKSGVVSGFGAAGSVVLILLWVYYSAQIFLLGAEFTWLYAYRFGSRRGQEPHPAAVTKSAVAAHSTAVKSGGRLAPTPRKSSTVTRPSGAGAPQVCAHEATRPRALARVGGWLAAAFGIGAAVEIAARHLGVIEMFRQKRFSWRR